MKEIAEAADIAVGQIYRDFANKEEIIAQLCQSGVCARLDVERLDLAIDANEGFAAAELLAAFCRSTASLADARMMSEIVAEAGRNRQVADIVRQCRDSLHKKITSALVLARWDIDATVLCDLLFARDLMQIMNPGETDASHGSQLIGDIIEKAIANVHPAERGADALIPSGPSS